MRLQSLTSLDAIGLDRLHRLLDREAANLWQFEQVGWGPEWKKVPEQAITELLEHLAQRPGGARIGVDALGMRFFSLKEDRTEPTASSRKISLDIVRRAIQDLDDQHDPLFDHHLATVLRQCFLPEEYPDQCIALVDVWVQIILCAPQYSYTLDNSSALIANRMAGPLLTKLMYNSNIPAYRLHRVFRRPGRKHLLKDVEPSEIVAWCSECNNVDRFDFAANAIDPFSSPDEAEPRALTAQALMLLEQAPDQARVLSAYERACTPNSYSGKRSEIVEARRAALASLQDFPPLNLHDQLEEILRRLSEKITKYRELEYILEENMGRTFE